MNMNNQKKMTRTAVVLDKIVRVTEVLLWIGAALAVIGSVLVPFLSPDNITVRLDFVKLILPQNMKLNETKMLLYVGIGMLGNALRCGAVAYGCRLVRNMLVPIKEGRPFELAVSANLKAMAWTVLICGGVWQVMNIVSGVMLINTVPIWRLLASGVQREYIFMIDLNFVLLSAILLFLSYIFNYGCALQQESDETL